MRPPAADREQQDQHGLCHASERDDPGVFQGSSDAGGQGDGHQHAADRRRCDDPSGRSEGPRHPCGKGPNSQHREERHESAGHQVARKGTERQARARAERYHLARTPGALEGGRTRGVGTEGGGRGVRRGDQPQRRPDDDRHPSSRTQREQGLQPRLLDREPGSHDLPEGSQPSHEVDPVRMPCRVSAAWSTCGRRAGKPPAPPRN